jgi:hypothetical protein
VISGRWVRPANKTFRLLVLVRSGKTSEPPGTREDVPLRHQTQSPPEDSRIWLRSPAFASRRVSSRRLVHGTALRYESFLEDRL